MLTALIIAGLFATITRKRKPEAPRYVPDWQTIAAQYRTHARIAAARGETQTARSYAEAWNDAAAAAARQAATPRPLYLVTVTDGSRVYFLTAAAAQRYIDHDARGPASLETVYITPQASTAPSWQPPQPIR